MKDKPLLSLYLLTFLILLQQSSTVAAADAYTFSERLAEKVVSYREDGETYYDLDKMTSQTGLPVRSRAGVVQMLAAHQDPPVHHHATPPPPWTTPGNASGR